MTQDFVRPVRSYLNSSIISEYERAMKLRLSISSLSYNPYLRQWRGYTVRPTVHDVDRRIARDPAESLQQLLVLFASSRHVEAAYYLATDFALQDDNKNH